MPLNDHGFLGKDIERIRLEIIGRHQAHFDLAYDVNAFCQRSKFLLQIHTKHGQEVVAASLFIKMLSDFQAAIIVLERGLVLQGEALFRCALEAFFVMKRMADDPSFVATWVKADETDRIRMFEAVRGDPSFLPSRTSPEELERKIDEIRRRIEEGAIRQLRVAKLMKDPELGDLRSLYMLWSFPVHSAPRAVQGYVEKTPGSDISGLKWGPREKDLDFDLAMGVMVMLAAWEPLAKLFTLDVNAEVRALDARLAALLAAKMRA